MSIISSIPTEVMVGLGSAAIGAWTSIQQQKNATHEKLVDLAVKSLSASNESASMASQRDSGTWGNAVRRSLAIMAGCYIFVWPALFAFLGMMEVGSYPVFTWLYPSIEGFWVWSKDSVAMARTGGYIFTPVHTHLASAAFFYYLGGTLGKGKRLN